MEGRSDKKAEKCMEDKRRGREQIGGTIRNRGEEGGKEKKDKWGRRGR